MPVGHCEAKKGSWRVLVLQLIEETQLQATEDVCGDREVWVALGVRPLIPTVFHLLS